MNDDLPPDFARLRTMETRAAHYLTRIRTRIATAERQQQTRSAHGRASVAACHRAASCPYTGLALAEGVSGIPPRRSTRATVGPGALVGSGQCGTRPRRAEGGLAVHLMGT